MFWEVLFSVAFVVLFASFAFVHWYCKDWLWRNHVRTQRSLGITNLERTREWEETTDKTAYLALLATFFGIGFIPLELGYDDSVEAAIKYGSTSDIVAIVLGLIPTGVITVVFLLHWYMQWFRRDNAWESHLKRCGKQNDESYEKTRSWQIFTTITGLVSLIIGILACCAFWYLIFALVRLNGA